MSLPTAARTPRRSSPKPAHLGVAALVLVLVVLGLASQCGSAAETGNAAPSTAVPTTTPPAPFAEAPQPADNETAETGRIAPPALAVSEPLPEPEPTPAETSTDEDSGGSAYYKNCSAARAAGVTPLYAGDPGYSSKLDRDGDGVACE